MKCPVCKAEMICKKKTYHYEESGLDNVYLEGVEIWECNCGEEIVSIPQINELHNLIARALVKKRFLLDGKEVRFLRKNMGLTALSLSKYLSVDNATISRWETNRQAIDKSHDKLLRLIYLNLKGMPTEEIKHLIEEDFVEINPERADGLPPYMIPKEDWSKSEICLTK